MDICFKRWSAKATDFEYYFNHMFEIFLNNKYKIMKLVISLALLFAHWVAIAAAPNLRFERLAVDEGLSQISVESVVQDDKGYIWLATHDGLNRYDGYEFKYFRHDSQDPHSLSNSFVNVIYKDNQGRLWVGTKGGLNRYDHQTQRFIRYSHDVNNTDTLSHNYVTSIAQDLQGNIWVGTLGGGLNLFDGQKFYQFKASINNPITAAANGSKQNVVGLGDDDVHMVKVGSKGYLWVGTAGGLNRVDTTSLQFEQFVHDANDSNSISHNSVYAMTEDDKGNFWVATMGGGLNYFDRRSGQFRHVVDQTQGEDKLADAEIWTLSSISSEGIWLGTKSSGLYKYHIEQNRFIHYKNIATDPYSLSHDSIRAIYYDDKGLLWIGTFGGGLNFVGVKPRNFGHFKHQVDKPDSLLGSLTMSFLIDKKGDLWVGTWAGGLNRQRAGARGFDHYLNEPQNPNSIPNNSVWTLFEDSHGEIWAGTKGGLSRYNPQTDEFINYLHDEQDPNSLSHDWVMDIAEDGSGNLWVATRGGGLNLFNRSTQTFSALRYDSQNPNSIATDVLMDLNVDQDGVMWIGTWGAGLVKFDLNSRTFKQYSHNNRDSKSLSYNYVLTVYLDRHNALWIGTFGGGLNRLDQNTGQFAHYREQDGLPNDTIYGMTEDLLGNLWVSTNKGLVKMVADEHGQLSKMKIYDVKDGLQSNEFNGNSFYLSQTGELFFGGINGFNRFEPQRIIENKSPPKIVLTDFLLFNRSVTIISAQEKRASEQKYGFTLPVAIDDMEHLTIGHRENLVSFEFAAFDYSNPMKNQYSYLLEGHDENWIVASSRNRRATYTNLSAGEYVLRIQASNSDGVWNIEGKALKVTVLPPWWLSNLAFAIYAIIIVGSLWAFHHYRTKSLRRLAAKLERRVNDRTATIKQLLVQKDRMFANISHEFRTPLTLILNPMESINKTQTKDTIIEKVTMAKRNGQRLLRMVEQLLALTKLEADQNAYQDQSQWRSYSLGNVLHVLASSFEPLFAAKNHRFTLKPFDDVILRLMPDVLETVITNLISNAIKYTPKNGEIEASVTIDGDKVKIAVTDNGFGIAEQDQDKVFSRFTRVNEQHDEKIPGAGIGLALVKELVEKSHGTIVLTSELGKGSTFTVTFPIPAETDFNEEDDQSSELSLASTLEVKTLSHLEDNAEPEQTEEEEEASGDKSTVLLIDDNADMRQLLELTLGETYHCIQASNGEIGLEKAQQNLPDIVISDVMMPGLNGFEVLQQLKLKSLTSHIPVILLTAKGDKQSRIQGWENNADDYIEKPFNAEELMARIDNLLSIRKLLRLRHQHEFTQTSADKEIDTPIEISLDAVAQQFFEQLNDILSKHYQDESLDVGVLAAEMHMSRRQFTRKIKNLLGLTPLESIRTYRLKRAAELLGQGQAPSVVTYAVGFTSHSYFGQCFKAQYNCAPSEYNDVVNASV